MGRFPLFQDPIDRAAVGAMAAIAGLTFAALAGDRWLGDSLNFGNGGRPRVQDFSWQDRQIGARDRAFILTFNRPVDRAAVEANLQIEPPLPGRWSWVGRRAAYTLDRPAPYGTTFTLSLADVRAQFGDASDPENTPQGREMRPFVARFSSRDRAFAYIGTTEEEQGRLLLYNLTRREQQTLTPPGLAVTSFQPYPAGDRILLGAIDTRDGQATGLTPRLYSVTTGLGEDPAGRLELILNTQTHQNLQFSLAMGGEAIVVQRASRADPQDSGLWLLPAEGAPYPLPEGRYSGEFRVTPDGNAVAVARGEGVALLSLTEDGNPPDFLPEFGRVLAFAPDGRAAAMVDFNAEDADRRFLQTLVQVTSNGRQQPLLDIEGSVLGCEYAPAAPLLYCALTQVEPLEAAADPSAETPDSEALATTPTEEAATESPNIATGGLGTYEEQPYLAAIALDSGAATPIPLPPGARDISFSLSPDGLALLFDRLPREESLLQPETAAPSWLWLWLPSVGEPEILPLQGRQPQWLP